MNISLDQKVCLSPQVLARRIGDETVILDLASGTYFGLDAVGARLWQLMSEGLTLTRICQVMLTEYQVEGSRLQQDVLGLVQTLLSKQLVQLED
jgi:hypothetical protein